MGKRLSHVWRGIRSSSCTSSECLVYFRYQFILVFNRCKLQWGKLFAACIPVPGQESVLISLIRSRILSAFIPFIWVVRFCGFLMFRSLGSTVIKPWTENYRWCCSEYDILNLIFVYLPVKSTVQRPTTKWAVVTEGNNTHKVQNNDICNIRVTVIVIKY
jgi:hypothetical protein